MRYFSQGQGRRPAISGINRRNTLKYFESRPGGMSLTPRLGEIAFLGQPSSDCGVSACESVFHPATLPPGRRRGPEFLLADFDFR